MTKPYSSTGSYSAEAYADCANAKLKFVYMAADRGQLSGAMVLDQTTGMNTIEEPQILFEAKFLAFVNEFSEQFSSAWDSEQFYGKSEPIIGFKNTKRMLSLGWQAPASNIDEAKANLIEIDKLTKMLYPAYAEQFKTNNRVTKSGNRDTDDDGISDFDELFIAQYGLPKKPGYNSSAQRNYTQAERVLAYNALDYYDTMANTDPFRPHGVIVAKPPLIGLQWSNIIKNRDSLPYGSAQKFLGKQGNNDLLLGYLENLSIGVALEAGFFTEGQQLYPKAYNLSCTFAVQHTHQLGRKEPLW